MTVRTSNSLACVMVLVGGAAMVSAQGRGAGAKPAATTGTVERMTVHGKSLEGNLEGDSPDREVTVYLPPSTPAIRPGATPSSICCTATVDVTTPSPPAWPTFRKAATGSPPRKASAPRSSSRRTRIHCTRAACTRARPRSATGSASWPRISSPTWTATTARSPTA